MRLRQYQTDLIDDIRDAWASGAQNVLAVLPTGAGKTHIFTHLMAVAGAPAIAIAHRQELVGQISVALGRWGVRHRVIGPRSVVKFITRLHMTELGRAYYDPAAPCAVASVDTLIRRKSELAGWAPSVKLWVQDEAHHVLRKNKWGTAAAMFPHAIGLGVTADSTRADGKGLGRDTDGLFDALVEGVSMRDVIGRGYLTEYRIFSPTTRDLKLDDVPISASTGDYSAPKLRAVVRKSRIVGDVVEHYQRIAPGRLGITFATDVETATDIATAYNAAGVPAEVVSHKTADFARAEILRRFRAREILQLVNVDLFGEGFDLPAIECVSFARPTESYGLFIQQFGRGLRPLEGKTEAIIIDHVGNVLRHGLPDARRLQTLDRREKRGASKPADTIPLRACPECTGVYFRTERACPYCGFVPIPASRSGPEFVDGDLLELDAATLAAMRGDAERAVMSLDEYRAELQRKNCPALGVERNVRLHHERIEAQKNLRESIAWWAGVQRAAGRPDRESYRRFFHTFGVDVLSAQALDKRDAMALTQRVQEATSYATR